MLNIVYIIDIDRHSSAHLGETSSSATKHVKKDAFACVHLVPM